jgi:beta-galactosidase
MTIDMQQVRVIEDGDRGAKLRTGRTGALPCFGIGWYRKALTISKADEGKRVFVEFDGAMSRSKVYLNGVYVGEWPYGYSSFSFELTKYIQ